MSVFMGNFGRANLKNRTTSPWYYYNNNTFKKSDWFFTTINTGSVVPVFMYRYPIVTRYDSLLNIPYTVDGENPAENSSNYVYKIYSYWGLCACTTTKYDYTYSLLYFLFNKLLSVFSDELPSSIVTNKDYGIRGAQSNDENFIGCSSYTFDRTTIFSNFNRSIFSDILPTDEESGVDLADSIFSEYLDYTTQDYGPYASILYNPRSKNVYVRNNNFKIGLKASSPTYGILSPCCVVCPNNTNPESENISSLNSGGWGKSESLLTDTNIYGMYCPCLGTLDNDGSLGNGANNQAVLCCKPGSIILSCTPYSPCTSPTYSSSDGMLNLTYIGVEGVR